MRVAFCGPGHTGKTTAAEFLRSKFGGRVLSFATPLKRLAFDLGWDGVKDEAGRRFLQQLGLTVREYREDYWLNLLLEDVGPVTNPENFFVDDLRFPNEFEGLKVNGFTVVRLEPEGFDLSGDWRKDPSETALPKWMADVRIMSHRGAIGHFRKELLRLVENMEFPPSEVKR